ncbi:hypothetical protein BaRGS_00036481, partial [Batillaria attramentaria]
TRMLTPSNSRELTSHYLKDTSKVAQAFELAATRWNDVGWHNPTMVTPNLDKYARAGVILNSSYVQYFCSPSRNAFMTGYFPYHTGLQHQVILDGTPRYLPLSFTTLPQHLKKAGYATHIVGKWHLGMCDWKLTPTYRGFDSFFGYYSGMEDYYTHMEHFKTDEGYDLRNDTEVFRDPKETHFNYLFTKHAIDVIEQHDPSTPLYLYLPFHLVHAPLQVPMRFENMYKNIQNGSRRTFCGMVSMMDESFGNITKALERAGLLDNALLVFTTDNGGPVNGGANNWPLRGGKTTFWEGGTRGSAFVYSTSLLKKTGYVNNGMMHAVDWFPTILQLAGLPAEAGIDGVDQWDMLSNDGPSKREEFVYNIDTILNTSDQQLQPKWPPRLYNIKEDPEERDNLAEAQPDMMRFMLTRLDQWMKSGVPPQNQPLDPRGDPKNWGGVWTPGWCTPK